MQNIYSHVIDIKYNHLYQAWNLHMRERTNKIKQGKEINIIMKDEMIFGLYKEKQLNHLNITV